MSRPGRPLRALAGLGVALSVWIAVRLPGMEREVAALTALANAQPPRLPGPALAVSVEMPAAPGPAVPPLLRAAAPLRVRAGPGPFPLLPAVAPARPPVAASALPPAVTAPPPVVSAPPPAATTSHSDPAYALAAEAYDRLRHGERRQAAALFDAALSLQPVNRQWQADRQALGRRWQLGTYVLLRDGGHGSNQPGSGLPGFAASPVLGGGQLGASLAFLPDPTARRPLALTLRANMAADTRDVQRETAQLAVGVRQSLLPGVSVAIERLVPLGHASRGAFTARLAAGGRWQRLEAYGEAGALDTGTLYAGGQARARLARLGPATLQAAAWASVQTGTPDVWRADVGPAITMQIQGVRLEANWRHKIGGNATPSSGPVLTVSAGF